MVRNGSEKIDNLENMLGKKGVLDEEIQGKIDELKNTFQHEENQNIMKEEKDLIDIPMNPLLKETVDLGGAEMAAGVYNVLGTAFVSTLTKSTGALAIAGPIIEKIGFFMWEAIKAYRTHHKEGTKFSDEFKANLSNGVKNLIIDITIHDTIYSGCMVYGLTHDTLGPVMLSFVSFLIALPPAIFIKYSGNELLYILQKQFSKAYGFQREKYYEARFIVNDHRDPKEIFETIGKNFGLGEYNLSRYHDTYFKHNIPSFSDRIGTVKLREVEDMIGNGDAFKGLEIAHTLPTKKTPKKESMYNYFYSRKEKGRKTLPDDMNKDELLKKRPYKKIIGEEIKTIEFDRQILSDKELRITLDELVDVTKSDIKKMIELKVYGDVKYLMEAMCSIMSDKHIDTQITTHPKIRLFGKK